ANSSKRLASTSGPGLSPMVRTIVPTRSSRLLALSQRTKNLLAPNRAPTLGSWRASRLIVVFPTPGPPRIGVGGGEAWRSVSTRSRTSSSLPKHRGRLGSLGTGTTEVGDGPTSFFFSPPPGENEPSFLRNGPRSAW